jgi:hypothetical protein
MTPVAKKWPIGDGMADFCVLYDGGAIDGYLNTGVLNRDSTKTSWMKLPGPFAGGVSGVPGSKVRLADIDGLCHHLLFTSRFRISGC